ncbi:hypothetical protein [Paludisphaera mucosa]|uniref:Uncharacterized protein n=1 Tax=Paludisphaera mucosa TaxID=3030827 RepID=A0ABT6F795_9BACT|nr:hypothetical protein [Paludisphaera mucosa]MDG3003407.1 hypothetical protein [Paludisphaera mucosa]
MNPMIMPARRLAPASVGSPSERDSHQATSPTPDELQALSYFELADRLVQAWTRNAKRLQTLDALRDAIASARRQLASLPARPQLAEAHLAGLLEKRDACIIAAQVDQELALALAHECEERTRVASERPFRRAVGG